MSFRFSYHKSVFKKILSDIYSSPSMLIQVFMVTVFLIVLSVSVIKGSQNDFIKYRKIVESSCKPGTIIRNVNEIVLITKPYSLDTTKKLAHDKPIMKSFTFIGNKNLLIRVVNDVHFRVGNVIEILVIENK